MEQLAVTGLDVAAVTRALRMRECNNLTAAYHLMHEASLGQVKQVRPRQFYATTIAWTSSWSAVSALVQPHTLS